MKNTKIDIKYGTDIREGSSPAAGWVLLAEGIQYETVRLCQVIPQHHSSLYRVKVAQGIPRLRTPYWS